MVSSDCTETVVVQVSVCGLASSFAALKVTLYEPSGVLSDTFSVAVGRAAHGARRGHVVDSVIVPGSSE